MVEKININTMEREMMMEGVSCNVLFGGTMSFACVIDEGGRPFVDDKDARYFSHEEEQATMLLKGKARYWMEGESMDLEPGDMFFIPPNTRHRAEILEGPVVFIFFYQPAFDPKIEFQDEG